MFFQVKSFEHMETACVYLKLDNVLFMNNLLINEISSLWGSTANDSLSLLSIIYKIIWLIVSAFPTKDVSR